MTFNWAVLVAYAAKTGEVSAPLFILYLGLIFWTVGYDTIYACQDIEDDAMVGIKSTARKFGGRVKLGVGVCFLFVVILFGLSLILNGYRVPLTEFQKTRLYMFSPNYYHFPPYIVAASLIPLASHLMWQRLMFDPNNGRSALQLFKSNTFAALIIILTLLCLIGFSHSTLWVPEEDLIFFTQP